MVYPQQKKDLDKKNQKKLGKMTEHPGNALKKHMEVPKLQNFLRRYPETPYKISHLVLSCLRHS